jgi:signal transduction histidine kinase
VLASIAHELNSPLASTESAAGHLASIQGEAARAISALRSMPQPLAGLVDRILARQSDVPYVDTARRKALAVRLAAAGCAEPDEIADDLCDLGETEPSDEDIALVAGSGGPDAVVVAWVLGSMFGSSALAAKAARRSADVVRSLNAYLDLARLDETVLVEFDIVERLRNCCAYGSAAACPLAFDLEEGLLAYGDPERLDLVWENLVKNALFAAGKTGMATVRARSDGAWTVVSVEDDGAGVDPAVRDRLFDPLISTKALEEGKGLGLDICRRIVDAHGGTISFESAPGRTVFTVRLPGKPDGALAR